MTTISGQSRSFPFFLVFCVFFALQHTGDALAQASRPVKKSLIKAQASTENMQQRVTDFVASLRGEALRAGVDPAVYDRIMPDVRYLSRDTRTTVTPELYTPVWTIMRRNITEKRISKGRDKLTEYADGLSNIELQFGVDRHVLAAVWAVETNYGAYMGHHNVFSILTTLTLDGRRDAIAKTQLITALRLASRKDTPAIDAPHAWKSNWIGAMGHGQFLAEAYRNFAVSYEGEGTMIDLWGEPLDALASTANFLRAKGYHARQPWGAEVLLPADFDFNLSGLKVKKTLKEWASLGLRDRRARALDKSPGLIYSKPGPASVLVPAGSQGPAFIVFDNFRAVFSYNPLTTYALTVLNLADTLRSARTPLVRGWPVSMALLDRKSLKRVQTLLQRHGFYEGTIDGYYGSRTRKALRAWQKSRNLPPDGFPTKDLLNSLTP